MLQQRYSLVQELLAVADWQTRTECSRLMLWQRFALQFTLTTLVALAYQLIQQLVLQAMASVVQQKEHLATVPNHLVAFAAHSYHASALFAFEVETGD